MKAGRIIAQSDPAQLIREGEEVAVIDTLSGGDITLPVLSRVDAAQSLSRRSIKETKEILKGITFLGGNKSMSILKNTILASIGALQVTRTKAEKIIDDLIKKGELDKSKRKEAILELLEKAEKSTADFRRRVAGEAEKAQKGVSKLAKDLSWVRQQEFRKLEAKVNKLAKAVQSLEEKMGQYHP